MHILPSRAFFAVRTLVALASAVAGDAMADLIEFAELFDVDMKEIAGRLAFIAAHRLWRVQGLELVESKALENAADSS